MKLKKITNGELIPPFYGVAWFDWQGNHAVCLPLGINVVAALGRALYFSVKHAGRLVMQNPRDAYAQGLLDGRAQAEGRRAGVEPSKPRHIEPTEPWPKR